MARIHRTCFLTSKLDLMPYGQNKLGEIGKKANVLINGPTMVVQTVQSLNLVKMWFPELKLGDALTSCPP